MSLNVILIRKCSRAVVIRFLVALLQLGLSPTRSSTAVTVSTRAAWAPFPLRRAEVALNHVFYFLHLSPHYFQSGRPNAADDAVPGLAIGLVLVCRDIFPGPIFDQFEEEFEVVGGQRNCSFSFNNNFVAGILT